MGKFSWQRTTHVFGVLAIAALLLGSTVRGASATCNSGSTDFANYVRTLNGFSFATNGMVNGSYAPPSTSGSAVAGDVATALAAAWVVAPQAMQIMLCNLAQGTDGNGHPITSGVFVDTDDNAPFGWSFWEVPGQSSGKGRYIAVGLKLWGGTANLRLKDLETLILTHLLGSNAKPDLVNDVTVTTASSNPESYTSGTVAPVYTHGPTNYALMAILARELGLMIYHDYVGVQNDVPGSTPSAPKPLCGTAPSVTFSSYSWTIKGLFSELGHIHVLGEVMNPDYVVQKNFDSQYLPAQLRRTPRQYPDPSTDYLRTVYTGKSGNPEWAGLLALTTPYDDFAETFRLGSESNFITSIAFIIGGKPAAVDLIANLNQSGSLLNSKSSCITAREGAWSVP